MLISVQLSLPRDARFVPVMRNMAGSLMRDLGAPAEAASDIQIALSEACGNAVRHASGTAGYAVSLGVGGDGCVIEVVDQGPGFDPGHERSKSDLEMEGGRGLLLISALVDDCEFIREDDENRLRLTKRWPSEALNFHFVEPAPTPPR